VTQRRFAPPWTVEEAHACFTVRDANGQALAYVYFEDESGRRAAAFAQATTYLPRWRPISSELNSIEPFRETTKYA